MNPRLRPRSSRSGPWRSPSRTWSTFPNQAWSRSPSTDSRNTLTLSGTVQSVRSHVHAGIAQSDVSQCLFVPIGVAGPRETEEVPLPHRALWEELGPAMGGLLRPRHLPGPRRSPRWKVDEQREARASDAGQVRAPVQDVGPVHEQAPRRAHRGHLLVGKRAELEVEGCEGDVLALLVRDD